MNLELLPYLKFDYMTLILRINPKMMWQLLCSGKIAKLCHWNSPLSISTSGVYYHGNSVWWKRDIGELNNAGLASPGTCDPRGQN